MGDLRFLTPAIAKAAAKRAGDEWSRLDGALSDLDRTILAVLSDDPDTKAVPMLWIVDHVGGIYETSEPPLPRPSHDQVHEACARLATTGLLLPVPFAGRWAITDAGRVLANGEW